MPTDIQNRIVHFLGTSPDDAHNRHRLIFFLITFFLAGIVFKLVRKDSDTVEMVKKLHQHDRLAHRYLRRRDGRGKAGRMTAPQPVARPSAATCGKTSAGWRRAHPGYVLRRQRQPAFAILTIPQSFALPHLSAACHGGGACQLKGASGCFATAAISVVAWVSADSSARYLNERRRKARNPPPADAMLWWVTALRA
jgi:hypothetical protein